MFRSPLLCLTNSRELIDLGLRKGAVSEGGVWGGICEQMQGEAKTQPNRSPADCSNEFESRIDSRCLMDIIIEVIRRNLDEI